MNDPIESSPLKDEAADSNRTGWLPAVLGIYLIATFLWRAFVPAHEFPSTEMRNLTIGLDLLCLVSLIGLQIQNSRKQPPVTVGLHILFWFALFAGLGMFAIRLNGNESWWTGHIKYGLLPRSPGEPGYEILSTKPANIVANNTKTVSNTAEPAAPESPRAVYKAFYAAYKNKDIKTLKTLISKDMFADTYRKFDRKKADELVDQALTEQVEQPPGPSDDTRNEKITGNTATVECLSPKGDWFTQNFVKEDGKWKLQP